MRHWIPLLALLACACASNADRIRWDADWKFRIEHTQQETGTPVAGWKWIPAPDNASDISEIPADAAWKPAQIDEDVFHGRRGFAWFTTTLTVPPDPKPKLSSVLRFLSVDDNATIWINGKKVFHHEVWNDQFDVPLKGVVHEGENQVIVLVQNTDGPGGIYRGVYLTKVYPEPAPLAARTNFPDKGWRTVHLPHDYVIEGTFTPQGDAGHGSLIPQPAWYRKHFTIPAKYANSSIWLDFEGVFTDSKVYLNGHLIGGHRGGYNGFTVDLSGSKFLKIGQDNILAVHVDPRKFEGWWYEGGGIYRHVWLNITPMVHITNDGLYAKATVQNLADKLGLLSFEVQVQNEGAQSASGFVRHLITNPSGKVVKVISDAWRLAPHKSGAFATEPMAMANVDLWSLQHPSLYKVTTTVELANGTILDKIETNFGFREIKFDADKGFFLNGEPVKLYGTCNHQDFIGVGIGMPDSVLWWRVKTLKGIGCNAYRTSHNEVAPALLDACDKLGLLVMDENREFGDTYTGKASPNTTTKNLYDISQLVRRDRNHPSIIMWSIANEEGIQGTPAGKRIGQALKDAVLKLDTSRPVVAAINFDHGRGLGDVTDLEGFNYGPGQYPSYHAQHPGHPMFGSETASMVSTRGEYADDNVRGYVTNYDIHGTDTVENAWEPLGANDYMEGGFVWTGFDYKGEPSPYGWPCVNSHFGILDMCGFWKDAAWYYKAWWGGKPTVHIFPHWNWPGKEGQPIEVWAYGNGDEIELFLNGQSLGRKSMPKFRHVQWSVPYQPGALMALSYKNGVAVAKDIVETTGAATRLRLTTDRNHLVGDNEDITMVRVEVLDDAYHVVPDAHPVVHFSITGPAEIAGVGNGNPSCHEPDQANWRSAYHGLAMVLARAKNAGGRVVLTAKAEGLGEVQLILHVSPGKDPKGPQ